MTRETRKSLDLNKILQKRTQKLLFALLEHAPCQWRDKFYRSKLNFNPLPDGFTISLAKERKELDQAFQILHEAYVHEGFSKPMQSGRRITDYHMLPSTSTIVAKFEGKVIGTLSIIRDSIFGLPVDKVVDLTSFRSGRERLGEVSSLAIKPSFRGRSGTVLFYLFKYLLAYCLCYFGVDRLFIVVNPARRALYESLLMFEPLKGATLKAYQFANNAPGICMSLNLKTLDQTWKTAYHGKSPDKNLYQFFFNSYSRIEEDQFQFPERPFYTAEDPVMTPELLNFFFNQCADGLCGLNDRQLKTLKSIYRQTNYEALWPQQTESNWQNLRWSPRFDVECLGTTAANGTRSQWLRVINASRQGIGIISDTGLGSEASQVLQVTVGDQKSVVLKVYPRWRSGSLFGLEIEPAGPLWGEFITYMETRRLTHATAERMFDHAMLLKSDNLDDAAIYR